MKTSDLTGPALDWAVDKAMGEREANDHDKHDDWDLLPYSTDWAYGGPIIEREKIGVYHHSIGDYWTAAQAYSDNRHGFAVHAQGPTPLIAAMRCYVSKALGDAVEIPEGLK